MPLGTKVGLGPGNVVLDADPALPARGTAPNFRPMSVVAKRLDGSRCHLVTKVSLGPGHVVFDGDSAPPKGAHIPNFRPTHTQFSSHVYSGQTVVHLSYC